MTIIRSTAYIGRHGESPKKDGRSVDELKPGQPQILYNHTGIGIIKPLIAEMGITSKQIKYGSSTRQRAIHSNLTILAGAFGLPIPETYEQALALQLPRELKEIRDDKGLDYFDLELNRDLVAKVGYPAYAKFWFENPDINNLFDVKITPAWKFIGAREEYFMRLVRKLKGNTRLIVNTTHSPNIEAMLLGTTGKNLTKIGELFSPGGTDDGHFLLHVDRHSKSGNVSNGIIERPGKGLKFKVLWGM
jgi:hypothetical protein